MYLIHIRNIIYFSNEGLLLNFLQQLVSAQLVL